MKSAIVETTYQSKFQKKMYYNPGIKGPWWWYKCPSPLFRLKSLSDPQMSSIARSKNRKFFKKMATRYFKISNVRGGKQELLRFGNSKLQPRLEGLQILLILLSAPWLSLLAPWLLNKRKAVYVNYIYKQCTIKFSYMYFSC